jgi:ubiquinone/menaquinone biosynthesis C-methylase UbiE
MSLITVDFRRLQLRAGDRLLDLGCGEGRHAINAYLTAPVHVIATDLNPQELHTASTRLQEAVAQGYLPGDGRDRSCFFVVGNGMQLPFAAASFDKIICSEVLEHVADYPTMLAEIRRVLKPGGLLAVSVPRFFPEWICWRLSRAYHSVPGGHVRIFTRRELQNAVEAQSMRTFARHWAHSLHVPYWWLRCLFWSRGETAPLIRHYHRFLVWDLMQRPAVTRLLERLLDPLMGKSIVMYFKSLP